MAGKPKTRAKQAAERGEEAPKKPPSRSRKSREQARAKKAMYGDLAVIAEAHGVVMGHGNSVADVLQACLDRAVHHWRMAAAEVDKLPFEEFWEANWGPNGAVSIEAHKWYRLETECRLEIEKLAGMMAQLGLDERRVQVQEAQAAVMISAIRDAAYRSGLTAQQVKSLGASLRDVLADAQAKAAQAVEPRALVGAGA